jgi:hypothetical protein
MERKGISVDKRNAFVKYVRFPKTIRILGESIKVKKGEKKGVLTAVVYLAAHKRSVPYGGANVCPYATPGCIEACLGHTSGRLVMKDSQNAQVWKTLYFLYLREHFLKQLEKELRAHEAKAQRKELIAAARMDGTSDTNLGEIMARRLPGIQFYDYTKNPGKAISFADSKVCDSNWPENYHVTFSLAETAANQIAARNVARQGGNVATVFRTKDETEFPSTFLGLPVINGDESDVRFKDGRGVCVGLTCKGSKAMNDSTGFVQEI